MLLTVGAGAMLMRFDWWCTFGEAQHIAYWTIVGPIDQFVFGMLFPLVVIRRSLLRIVAGVSLLSFLMQCTEFHGVGGFHHCDGTPSKSPLWIFIPTAEANLRLSDRILWPRDVQDAGIA
jgi:hypothetical protein